MNDIPYVSDEAAAVAREMESRIQRLPPEAGVLFVGVEVAPAPGGKSNRFTVRLGIHRRLEESTGLALVKKVLEQELNRGEQISVSVFRGVAGATGELALPRLGASPS